MNRNKEDNKENQKKFISLLKKAWFSKSLCLSYGYVTFEKNKCSDYIRFYYGACWICPWSRSIDWCETKCELCSRVNGESDDAKP